MKKVFIAATKQNDGKTTVCLGLIRNFQLRFKKVGFIKPIGQRYLQEEGLKIDEDSWLIEEVCGIKCGLKDMSPIAVEKGFTEKYIARPDKKAISRQIKEAYRHVSKNQNLVIIEGTGHAGVGSVFDHSNAAVAKLLGAKAIIISSGGIGRPIDEIILNKALFEREGVKVLGAIVNKVLPEKFDKISRLVRQGLKRKGVQLLGVIPYNPMLSYPSVEQVLEETDFQLLCGREYLENPIAKVVVGAMHPDHALKYISDDSLMITSADRQDMIKATLSCYRDKANKQLRVSGMILTGEIMPEKGMLDLLSAAKIPVLSAKKDTYGTVACLQDINVKLRPHDAAKINNVVRMVRNNLDLNEILKGI